jgi:hypothetical protein
MTNEALPTEEQEVRAVNSREELLLRAKRIARRVQERVQKVLGRKELRGPPEQPSRLE